MKKRRFLIVGVLLLLIGLYLLNCWFDSRYQHDKLYKTQWMMSKKNTYYDYVVLGASHAYVGFDIDLANKYFDKKGINISLDGSLIPTQSVMADLYYNRNQNKSKYLLFCIDNPMSLNTELLADIGDGRMMPWLQYPEVFNFYRPYGVKWYFDRYVPFWKYAEYNYYWGPHIFANTFYHYMKPDFDTATGSRYDFNHYYDNSDTGMVSPDFDVAHSEYKYFKKILQICKDNQVKPILFTLPLGRADTSATSQQSVAAFKAYCKQQHLDYVYLGNYLNYQFEYYGTKGHLNRKGAELATQKLMDILVQEKLIEPAEIIDANHASAN